MNTIRRIVSDGLAPRASGAAPAREVTQYFSKVLGKALETLDAVRSSREPLSLGELTCRVGIAKTSLFRILHTLEKARYLERDALGRYRMAGALSSAAPPGRQDALVRAALPRMRELARACGETVSVAMAFEHHIEVVATLQSPQLVRMGNAVGRLVAPHASALGKAILAFQSEEQREQLLRGYGLHRFTAHTIVDETRLEEELEAVRTRGYSTDIEERVLDGCCFGAPICGPAGRAVTALSVSMPRMRVRDDHLRQRIIAAVRRAADAMSTDPQRP
jgi:DNA-binding IclR family transcriptional regulator